MHREKNVVLLEKSASAIKRAELKQAIERYVFGHLPPEVPEGEKQFLLNFALNLGLNPWKGEIYFIPFKTKDGTKVQKVVSYLVYVQRAEKTGLLNGWEVELSQDTKTATCIIYRKDWDRPFKWTVHLQEVKRDTRAWREMPGFMLRKVCIAQAFRLAFPGATGELPYIPEEAPIEAEVEVMDTQPQTLTQAQAQQTSSPSSPPEKEEKEDPRVAQARKLAEAKGVEIDVEPTDIEWVQLYTTGILTGRLARGQKMSALLARLKKQDQPAEGGKTENKQTKQPELLK